MIGEQEIEENDRGESTHEHFRGVREEAIRNGVLLDLHRRGLGGCGFGRGQVLDRAAGLRDLGDRFLERR